MYENEPDLRRGIPHCLAKVPLDLVEANPDGMPPHEVARALGVGAPRVRQIENAGLFRARVARLVAGALESLSERLPPGCRLESVYPSSHDAARLHVIVKLPSVPPVTETGLPRRQRRGHVPK